MNWSSYYPAFTSKEEGQEGICEEESVAPSLTKDVEVADIGCGFGGLLVALAPLMPDTLLLGMLAHILNTTSTNFLRDGDTNTGY
jgi:tRNA (guanine-N7-)-methyltransferase